MVSPSPGDSPAAVTPRFGVVSWMVIVIAASTKLWLTACRTLDAIGWADYDDHWFLRKAISILDGRWLGPYNSMTLIKGAAYPLWIAFVSRLGIPLLPAQQLLYALASLAVSVALAPSIRSSAARVVLFVVVLFNPMTFSDDIASRVAREGFYPALGLLIFAGVAGAALRLEARRRDALPWVLLSGVAFAVFLYMLLKSGLVKIGGGDLNPLVYLSLAFVSGFSERLGPDLITRAENALRTSSGPGSGSDKA